jgi:tRNA (guanine10-N2)-dimethyltransferase
LKFILELSGEHPDIPYAEVAAILQVYETRTQVAITEVNDPEIFNRFAYTHVAIRYISECEATKDAFVNMLSRLYLVSDLPFCGRVKKMADCGMETSTAELERLIGFFVSGQVSFSNPGRIFRAVISDGRCYFGEVVWELDRNPYHMRKPGKRPFFHPGVMMPRMIRSLVNISGAKPGEIVLDSFCGTGGTLIESEMLGCFSVGTDADPAMISGSRMNHPGAMVAVADAVHLPFPDGSIDHVVSDLPYGQSVLIIGSDLTNLYLNAFSEIRRVIKPEKRSIIVTHRDIRDLAGQYFSVVVQYEQRVHRSLTRRILVVVK